MLGNNDLCSLLLRWTRGWRQEDEIFPNSNEFPVVQTKCWKTEALEFVKTQGVLANLPYDRPDARILFSWRQMILAKSTKHMLRCAALKVKKHEDPIRRKCLAWRNCGPTGKHCNFLKDLKFLRISRSLCKPYAVQWWEISEDFLNCSGNPWLPLTMFMYTVLRCVFHWSPIDVNDPGVVM